MPPHGVNSIAELVVIFMSYLSGEYLVRIRAGLKQELRLGFCGPYLCVSGKRQEDSELLNELQQIFPEFYLVLASSRM
jgi:hypothetical protein